MGISPGAVDQSCVARIPSLSLSFADSVGAVVLPATGATLRTFILGLLRESALEETARSCVAKAFGWTPERLMRSVPEWSEDERDRLRTQFVVDDATALAWDVATGPPGDAWAGASDLERTCRAARRLLGELPPVVVSLPPGHPNEQALSAVVRLVESVPDWHWTLHCSRERLGLWLFAKPDSHIKATLRSAWLRSRGQDWSRNGVELDPGVTVSASTDAAAVLDSLAAAREAMAEVLDEHTQAPRTHATDPAVERARSLAELALYRLLESLPETTGAFVLNERMSFHFGPRAAELDLYSEGLSLCVEVDGPHHFVDADAYRRDRRKDALLQRHGLWVIRTLAEDVVRRTEEVKAHVLAAVRARRKEGSEP